MVVLGEAGAGKTVLAVRLVLDQLSHRATAVAAPAGEPVPVRINASGWDGSTDFTTWLVHQLATDYGLNTREARAMVDSDLILPVLDGLDEMDEPEAEPVLASAALDRLNEPPWRNRAVVVACRSRVYTAIRELRGDAVCNLRPPLLCSLFRQRTSTSTLSSIATILASAKRRGRQLQTSLNRQTTGSWPPRCAHRGFSAWPRPLYTGAGTRPP